MHPLPDAVTDRCSECASPVKFSIIDLTVTPDVPMMLTAPCPFCHKTHRHELSDTVSEMLLEAGAQLDWADAGGVR